MHDNVAYKFEWYGIHVHERSPASFKKLILYPVAIEIFFSDLNDARNRANTSIRLLR